MGVMELEMIKPGKTGPTLLVHAADDPECRQNVPAFFSPCGAMGITPTTTVAKMAGRNVSIEDFANFSLIPAGKPVVDKTGLQGKWDITLDFVQDSPGRTADAPPEETGPTFRDALKQQMGLKMVPGQGMVEDCGARWGGAAEGKLKPASSSEKQVQDDDEDQEVDGSAAVVAYAGSHIVAAAAECEKQDDEDNDQHVAGVMRALHRGLAAVRINRTKDWGTEDGTSA